MAAAWTPWDGAPEDARDYLERIPTDLALRTRIDVVHRNGRVREATTALVVNWRHSDDKRSTEDVVGYRLRS